MDEGSYRERFPAFKRWVVKIGSALLSEEGLGLNTRRVEDWSAQIAALVKQDCEVALVSSGAVAEGCHRLGLEQRPQNMHLLQAAAAVGQMGLIQAYEAAFQKHGLHTAMVLLTHEDLSDRKRYLNARSTLRTLLKQGVVPVINENDTVATEEIRFGDNDTLAALVTNLIEADALVILTDQRGLYEMDPRQNPTAPLVSFARIDAPELDTMVSAESGKLGRGGMVTKLSAARLAARSGALTVIASGREAGVLSRISGGASVGTLLGGRFEPLDARKRWIVGQLKARGRLTLDAGAVKVLCEGGKSLLPVGVSESLGSYARGDVVLCLSPEGKPVAKGLINYSSEQAERILGCNSDEIEARLGFLEEPELVHRDNLVLL